MLSQPVILIVSAIKINKVQTTTKTKQSEINKIISFFATFHLLHIYIVKHCTMILNSCSISVGNHTKMTRLVNRYFKKPKFKNDTDTDRSV